MSGEEGRRGSVTRRDFVKVTSTVLGATALASAAQPVMKTLAADFSAGQVAAEGEQVFSCVCRPNCAGACRHKVTVRDGRVVKVAMEPLPDERYNRICLRGLSHAQRLYDPERIKYPMKRAGERGENKWERISWDEAIATITGQWKEHQAEFGKQAVSFSSFSGSLALLNGTMPGMMTRLRNLIGGTSMEGDVDAAITMGVSRVVSPVSANFNFLNEAADMANARTIVCWGYNLTEATIHNWHFVADALENGAKLVVIDPVFTHIAAKADQYIPIRCASDPALILSMIQVLISENLYDRDFILANTVGPFLVREDNKMFLRMSDLGVPATEGPVDPTTGQPTVIDPAAVWDPASGSAVVVGSVQAPVLSGSFEVGGVRVRTAFDLLVDAVAEYTPEAASKITEIDAGTIRDLALLYAHGRPVWSAAGFGSQAYTNGLHAGFALGTLAAITGNVGVSGASVGADWHMFPGINWTVMFPNFQFGPKLTSFTYRDVLKTGTYQGSPFPIKSLYIFCGNHVSALVNRREIVDEVLSKLELIVVADTAFTDTARQADIVLPAAHWYEMDEVVSAGTRHPFIQYSNKAVDPLYEAKSDSEIFRLLAEGMGVGEYFSMTDDEYMVEALNTPIAQMMGITVERLRKEGAIRYQFPSPKPPYNYVAFEDLKFYTPSGRMEFYCENPAPRVDHGQAWDADRERLPRFFPPAEAWPENPLYEKYPLVLMSERPRFRVHTQWFGTSWLRELDPEPIVKIPVVDAAARGIKHGDYVEVFNDRGHAVAKAVLTNGMKPGALTYPKGWEAHQMKAGHFSELSGTLYDPVAHNASFFDTLVDVRLWNGEM